MFVWGWVGDLELHLLEIQIEGSGAMAVETASFAVLVL